tara:strand:+ start:787 stop:999 length:213 start_codon:yes stop_codon:yes gene_type:complete
MWKEEIKKFKIPVMEQEAHDWVGGFVARAIYRAGKDNLNSAIPYDDIEEFVDHLKKEAIKKAKEILERKK